MGHRIDELPVITTPSDSDKVVVEHDGLTSQITLARLIAAERSRLDQLESALQSIGDGAFEISFSNTSSILTQAETIMSGQGTGTYFGWLSSYGHQDVVGTPENDNYYVTLNVWNSGNAKLVLESTAHDKVFFKARGGSSGWDANWTKRPGRAEIESINNSLTKSFLTVTPSADVTVVRCTACVVAKTLIMNGVITTTATKATGTTLFTISTVTIHSTTDFFAGSSGTIIPFYLATNGEIKCNAPAPAGNYFFNLSAVVYG